MNEAESAPGSDADLKGDVESLRRALAEAREQQLATAEILRVIGTSPMDTQPVFAAIARSGVQVCGAQSCALFVVDRDMLRVAATHGVPAERVERFRTQFPMPLRAENHVTQVLHERRVFHLADIEHNLAATPEDIENARLGAYRTRLMVPMLRGDNALGLIAVTHQAPTPFSDQQIALLQTFADQAVIAIENVRLFTELEARNRDLTETLEQQTATSEILRVISHSQTDVQPVFDTIVQNAARLCHAANAAVFLTDGRMVHHHANYGSAPEALAVARARFPRPLDMDTMPGMVILTRSVVHVPDTEEPSAVPLVREVGRLLGFRSSVAVPMLREGEAIGSINVARRQPGPFSDSEVELLQTFADQAVIAIENVRLFKELQTSNHELTTALEQQTAIAEILRVISSSVTDPQSVFDTIVKSAVRLCGGTACAVLTCDDESIHVRAQVGEKPETREAVQSRFPVPLNTLNRDSLVGRVVLDGQVVHVHDFEVPEAAPEGARTVARMVGYRSALFTPMFRDGRPIGLITVGRRDPGPFSEEEMRLMGTFADQAVIAIENVRLFDQVQARTRELTEALEYQTATSDVLTVISRSPTDAQPVFDMIAESAARLCEAQYCFVYRFEAQLLHFVAHHGLTAEVLEINRRAYPAPPSRKSVAARAVLERSVVQIPDVNADPDYALGAMAAAGGYHSAAAVPILRDGLAIGSIAVTRAQAGLLPDRQIELLKTFADQAVIAIENVRLFKELEARTGELTQSVEKLTALGEVSQVLSSTLDLDTVLTTIVNRAVHLSGADGGQIFEYDEVAEEFQPRASNEVEEVVAATQHTRPRKGEGAVGRMAVTREAVQIPDIALEGAYESRARGALLRSGRHALLAVPLLSEEHIVGGLVISRNAAGAFPVEIVELLKTFATQSALAIQNARLFQEIEDKSRQLEAASRHKSEFLANMSHEL